MRYTILLGLAILIFGCTDSNPNKETMQQVKETNETQAVVQKVSTKSKSISDPGDTFPFNIDLKKADGSITNSKEVFDYADGPTIVTFWLTTCYPCKLEMAAMKQKYAKWQEEADFQIVAISTDFEKNYPNFVKMVNENNWPWESYNDVNRQFWRVMPGKLNGLPQVFVFDTEGEIVYHKRKYKPGDEDILFNKIKELQ